MSQVAKNTKLLLTAFVVQKLLSLLYLPFVARSLGVEKSGRYFLVLSFVTLFSVLIDMGLANVIAKEVAKSRERAEEFIANIFGAKAILALLTFGIIVISAKLIGYSVEMQGLIVLASLIVILEAVHGTLYGALRGLENMRYESLGIIGGQLITVIIGIIAILGTGSLQLLILALVAGGVFNVFWSIRSLHIHGIKIRLRFSSPALRGLFYLALPFAASAIFARVYGYLDTVLLSKLSSATEVGLYTAVYKLVFVFQFIPIALTSSAYPAMSRAFVENREQLNKIFATSIRILWIVALPVTLVLAGMSGAVTQFVYSTKFLAAKDIMTILALSLPLAFIYWPLGSMLNATDHQKTNAKIMGLTMLVNAGLNLVLIASAVLVLFSTIKPALLGLIKDILKATLVAVALAIPLHFLAGRVSVILLATLSGLVYLALLYGLKIITSDEVNVVLNLLKRKSVEIPASPNQ